MDIKNITNSDYNRIKVEDLLNDNPATHQKKARRSSTSTRPNVFDILCDHPQCDRKFATVESLRAHQKRSHAAPTNFACQYCHSTFSTSPNRNKHVRSVHEKVKPFKCATCGAWFGFRDGLQRHMEMVHDQLRPFSCSHCHQKFKTKSHMVKHSLSLHPEMHQRR